MSEVQEIVVESEILRSIVEEESKIAEEPESFSVSMSAGPGDCAICQDKLETTASLDNCIHKFCYECILNWV